MTDISALAFQTGIDLASDAILVADAGGRVTFVNSAADDLFGAGQAVGKYLETLFETSVEPSGRHVARAIGEGEQRVTAVVRGMDGERRAVRVRLQALPPEGVAGGNRGVVAAMQEVTDELRARQAVAKSEARYHNVFEGASDAIYTLDLNGSFTSVNAAACRLTGAARDELIGRSIVPFVDTEELPMILEHFHAAGQGESRHYECHFTRRSGARLLLSVTNTPVRNGAEIVGVLGIARDVSELHRASVEREELRRQLGQAQKLEAIGQLVRGVAHELNNPLAVVMAYAQFLLASPALAGDEHGEDRESVQTILDESMRAAKIVSNLLTFARHHQPERAAIDLNQIVTDTVELRRFTLSERRIEVVLDLDPVLPLTWADSFQLQQVLLNLIANAERAMDEEEGGHRLTIATRYAGETITLRVTDSGKGIDAGIVDQIFNPFFTTRGVGMGIGLGLAISDGIVREHGGRVRVESVPGEGASFIVELPYADPTAGFFSDPAPVFSATTGS